MATAAFIRQHLAATQPGLDRFLLTLPAVEPLHPSGIEIAVALPRIIIRQMLSGKASETIIARAEQRAAEAGLQRLSQLPELSLIEAGCSRAKAKTIVNFNHYIERNGDPFASWAALSNEDLLRAVMSFKGIGRWTAAILAMFHFGREDIFPAADSSLQKAIRLLSEHQVYINPSSAAPYRTYLAIYLWQLVDQNRI